MGTIQIQTWVNAPMERCFKLSLSVDLHALMTQSTGGKVVSRVKGGLLGVDDTMTWRGRYFGMRLVHTSLIDACRPYMYFREVMVEGMFERLEHEHHYAPMDDGTRMRDEVRFTTRWGVVGKVAEKLFLRRYLIRFLKRRNAVIKRVAESGEWRQYLGEDAQEGHEPPLEFERGRAALG
ncbi:MAG: SRPBCC family protein [Edaphobacter sp.]